ncbi:MAG: glycoside hydrolase family 99-like domain-containing protein [Methylomonas sp.]|nr:glycoside hydrolase family 99-like domain-containing protein [Methylomonas sp.]PPD22110.1 MAG: lipopolysaccharide biosynthesis protein [Methylomonas sp.]PPD42403.1 MAG: lipopolysaccharide biosynthesis protein [Methylomonas sp.]PPD53113.1 MAG: lipopolysaccharide biosynthesis protein [Methylomonas sp.]
MTNKTRTIAFYLPQFHPIPENDLWWGKGFTEWTNTAKAKPLYLGHSQPNIPSDLGFYDLRVADIRIAQAEMARSFGIEGFCYYHYWFAGKRLLERPLNEVLSSGEPDYPFCLCWANQTWTGIWHGEPNRVLIEQTYPSLDDHKNHFYELLKAFSDSRYITVDNKPLFIIYCPTDLPDCLGVTDYWRELALKSGLNGLFLVGVSHFQKWDPHQYGLDAVIDQRLPFKDKNIPNNYWSLKAQSMLGKKLPTIYDYKDIINQLVRIEMPGFESYPCVIPRWDNTPRSGSNGLVFEGVTLELFQKQLERALTRIENLPESRKFVFLKAWNEWAEGNYLEPDLKTGTLFLKKIKEILHPFSEN